MYSVTLRPKYKFIKICLLSKTFSAVPDMSTQRHSTSKFEHFLSQTWQRIPPSRTVNPPSQSIPHLPLSIFPRLIHCFQNNMLLHIYHWRHAERMKPQSYSIFFPEATPPSLLLESAVTLCLVIKRYRPYHI